MENAIETVWKIWSDGGWLMGPLALLGVFIYSAILSIYFQLRYLLNKEEDEDLWKHWVDCPAEAVGSVGSMVQHVGSKRPAVSISAAESCN